MKTTDKKKRVYTAPKIEYVKLDNEISLILESNPPTGPNEGSLMTPEYFKNDPFKSNMV
jgi:hypothetical protein